MTRGGKGWLIASVLSLLTAIGGAAAMAVKVTDYNKDRPGELFYFQPVNLRAFTFAGRPVTIEDRTTENGEVVRVTYGTKVMALRPPPEVELGNRQLPGLVRHQDWLTVLRFTPAQQRPGRDVEQDIASGEAIDRLAFVVRTMRPGADPDKWGKIWKKAWVFDFLELTPEGGIEEQRLGFPTTSRSELAAEDELKEGTWQFQASLMAMPKGSAPRQKFKNDAVSAMGWTLPFTAVSILVLTVSLAMLVWARNPSAESPPG